MSDAGYGVVPLEQARAMDGLTLFKGLLEGRFPAPPITRTLGFRVSEVELGRVVFDYTPVYDHYNPLGTVHGGWISTLLDSAMGCCVHTRLPANTGYTTLEAKVNLVRAITAKTGTIRATGKVIHLGGKTATAEARLEDAAGKLYAHGTTTCIILG